MREVLVLTRCFPANFNTAVYGIFQRFRLFLEALNRISSRIHIVFFIRQSLIDAVDSIIFQKALEKNWGIKAKISFFSIVEQSSTDRLNEYFFPIFSYKFQNIFAPCSTAKLVFQVSSLIDYETDLIFVHRLNSMPPVLDLRQKNIPIVFDLDDIEHKKFIRDLKSPPFWLGKLSYYLHIPSIFFGENQAIRRSHLTFVCSEGDKLYLKCFNPSAKIEVLPNSVVFPHLASERRLSNVMLFVGSYTYGPNVDAAEILIKNIFPKIREEIPSSELWLVGNRIELLSSYGKNIPGVRFIGFVESLEEIYRDTTIVCCPIRSGGGTRIKILEAAAYGLPVVSTTVGAEGLNFEDGKTIIIEDDDLKFAAACIKLFRNRDYAEIIGLNARKAVRRYSRDSVLLYLESILRKIPVK